MQWNSSNSISGFIIIFLKRLFHNGTRILIRLSASVRRVKLAGGNLLEGGGVEDQVYSVQGGMDAVVGAYVADVELQLCIVQVVPHVFLFLFVTGKDADLLYVSMKKAAQDGVTEGTGATGYEKRFATEHVSLLMVVRNIKSIIQY
jgi:hypothetical protein